MARISIAGTEARFTCADGDTILRAALRTGIGLPYKCNSGACGECRFQLVEGQLAEDNRRHQGLSDRDIERGRGLACQARPLTDCTIGIRPDRAAIPAIPPVAAHCRILSVSDFGQELIRLRVSAPTGCLPGQYALLRLGVGAVDSPLGIIPVPETPEAWDFLVPRNIGDIQDSIAVDGPYGTAFHRSGSRHNLCVADGRGLAQAAAIVRAVLADPDCETVSLFVASGASGGPADQRLFDADPRLTATWLAAAPDAGDGQRVRQLTEALQASLHSAFEDNGVAADFYLFGSARMVAGCRRMLSQDPQVRSETVYFDAYYEDLSVR